MIWNLKTKYEPEAVQTIDRPTANLIKQEYEH